MALPMATQILGSFVVARRLIQADGLITERHMGESTNLSRVELTNQVEQVANQNGAALVGFAPISRFDNASTELHPSTIFPSVKTVIALAILQPRGVLKAVEDGTYWQA